jgi:hypothetical protein
VDKKDKVVIHEGQPVDAYEGIISSSSDAGGSDGEGSQVGMQRWSVRDSQVPLFSQVAIS